MNIKKFIKKFAVLALLSSVTLMSVISANASSLDINQDGTVDIIDATDIQKVLANLTPAPDNFNELADVDGDGSVDISDATYIQKYLAGMLEVKPTQPSVAYPSSLKFDTESLTLGIGEEYTLTRICDVEDYTYSFVSGNSDIASVNQDGTITALSSGTAQIACTTENGITAICSVTVKPLPTSITLNKTDITLGVGEQFDLNSYSDSTTAAYYRDYFSDNPEVASVEKSGGLVTAKSAGTAVIRCELINGTYATCTVTVKPMTTSLTLNATSLTLGVGEQFDLDSYANSGSASYYRYYYSDNTDVATVAKGGGLVTAQSVGSTTVRCELNNGVVATCKITVKAAPTSSNFSINYSSNTIKVGQSFTLTPTFNNSASNVVTYSTDNSMVATVSSTGVISARMQGTANITLTTYNGVSKKCKVTVSGSVVKCLDVSTWQGTIDFNKVKADGYDYVIIRAGYGRETYQKDTRFETNYANAKAAGLKVGAYWFSYAMSADEALIEADACLYCLGDKSFDLPVYYDMEYQPALQQLSSTEYTNMAVNFCEKIKAAGYKPGVYASASVFDSSLKLDVVKQYSIWNAEWNSTYSVDCDVWQYSDCGTVMGITENVVDMNYIFNLNIAD
jgi:GH25 family lysozyme M1 (1,4-beta-N-acetylmuramidase)